MGGNREIVAVKKFLVEVVVATLIFFVVAIPAVALDGFVKLLSSWPMWTVSSHIISGLKGLEVGIFWLDLGLCTIFLLRSSFMLLRELWPR